MNFTYDEKAVNKARSEYLYDGEKIPLYNKVFVRSFYKSMGLSKLNGTLIAQTLRAPGDYIGGRDSSQYINIKRAGYGNAFVGNR